MARTAQQPKLFGSFQPQTTYTHPHRFNDHFLLNPAQMLILHLTAD